MQIKLVFTFLVMTVLTGCSTTFVEQILEKDYDSFYLRGVFTWWEADENYKVQLVEGKLYKTSVKLIADGVPYDFKFADENYTPGYHCGSYATKDLLLGEIVQAQCESPEGNFQFTPQETGTYDFFIDFTDEDSPSVFIQKAS